MNYLSKAKKASPQAPIITVVGFPGAGKSTLAGLFPSPIFIQAESASTVFEVMEEKDQPDFFPELPEPNKKRGVKTSEVILDQLRELATEDHPFKTVVIDTATSLNLKFEREVVEYDDDPRVQDIANAAGGFHKGYGVLAGLHAKVMQACLHLAKRKGITVVILSHAGFEKIKSRPDSNGEYTVFSPDMHKDSKKIYVGNSDAVLYLKAREFVMGHEENKKGQTTKLGRVTNTGERVLIASSDGTIGYVDAKNRYSLPSEMELEKGENPILQYIPFFSGVESAKEKQAESSEEEINTSDDESQEA